MTSWLSLYTERTVDQSWIKHDHVRRDGKHEFTILVMKIASPEMGFAGGRFERFDRVRREWEVRITHTNECEPWWVRCEGMVNWIAENTTGAWSLHMDMENIAKGDFVFSFDDARIGAFFKLLYA